MVSAKKSKRIEAFFDSGSSFSIVDESVIKDVGYLKRWVKPRKIELGDGRVIVYKNLVLLGVKMNNNEYFHKFYVANIPDKMIIGVDFLQEYGHTLEFKNDKIKSKNLRLKNSRGRYVL